MPGLRLDPLRLLGVAQTTTFILIAGAALALFVATGLALFGLAPWLSVPLSYGGDPLPGGEALFQVGLLAVFLALAASLPSLKRVLQLEAAHRDFQIGMEDVARAFWMAHRADREGVFQLKREFDAVRERYFFLKTHPDLTGLEPQLLELAAQMGSEARDLAQIYSDERVARARELLELRWQEAADLQDRISKARQMTADLRARLDETEARESVARAQLDHLREDLDRVLPEITAPAGAAGARYLRLAARGIEPAE
ncbi:MAG: DNA repair protein [Pseudomonadota bacterium]